MKPLIKTFSQISKKDTSIAGGKGASLGEMTQTNMPIPPGFIITAQAFDSFLSLTNISKTIELQLSKINYNKTSSIDKTSRTIRNLIAKSNFPKQLEKETTKHFKKLKTSYVAVRSSATAEDSSSASWAGELESFLNTDEKSLITNIKRCWSSLFTPRALMYRHEKGLLKTKVSVAVVIQKMVQSEIAGITFTVHPVTQDHNQMIHEAVYGLGEAIVSGELTPDSYVVHKDNKNLVNINLSRQEKMLVKGKTGNLWVSVPAIKQNKQKLSFKQIIKLNKLCQSIEKHYGFPCDIEWGIEKDKIYILQSRPITTISEEDTIEEFHKISTRPLSLLDCECWDIGERIKLPEKFNHLLFFDSLFIYTPKKGVSVYYNFTDLKQDPRLLLKYLEKNIAWFKKEKIKIDKSCKELRKLIKNKSNNYKKIANLNHEIWPLISVANIFGDSTFLKVSSNLRKICIQIREESDDILHPSLTYLNKIIENKFQINTQNVSLSEILNNKIPNAVELKKREAGWAFHHGDIIFDIKKYCKQNKFKLFDPTKNHDKLIKGDIACKGYAKGMVKVIFELSDLSKVKKGNILVTPMTTPEMLPALKKASAIITDEGGITCHAAIISRELKIPCIIGTKNATEILENDDLVEVDATSGIIKILKRGN